MPNPIVSVLIPTYNGAPYIAQCVQSVLNQTIHNVEVVLVDDGSTDNTVEIARKLSEFDDRVKLKINDRNLGLVENWNRCIDLSRGEWVKFVFQDDYIRNDCLERMLEVASRPIVFCRREFLFEQGTENDVIKTYSDLPQISSLFPKETDISPDNLSNVLLYNSADIFRNFFGEPTAALLHRSLFSRFGAFNADLEQLCDLEFWIRVCVNTGLSYSDEKLATFRCHSSSTSASNRDATKDERISVFDQLIILHECAYNRHYRSLRRIAESVSPKRSFGREFAQKAVWVQARARDLANRSDAQDESWIKKWEQLVQRYPYMAHSKWHVPYRLRELWARHFEWRFRT